MAVALEQLIKQLTDSGIVAAGKLENFLPPKAHPKSAEELAHDLIEQNQLTSFQAQHMLAGKGKALFLGNYTLLDKIGAGGMGQVFKAQHRLMKRVVALKMLPPSVTKDPAAIARFRREVEAAARLSHPNIVAAHDADEADGVNILVMEFVQGSNLSAIVKNDGPLPVAKAVNYVLQVASGLDFAHGAGVVHRDIKPSNLLLDRKGTVKILDMGLARVEPENGLPDADLTGTGTIMGTIDYMAPEQARSTKSVDARADIYSLGCVLHYLITGHAIYDGDGVVDKLLAHREEPIPSLAVSQSGVSARLDAIFCKMVAKQPGDRYQLISEVIADLENWQADSVSEPTSTFVTISRKSSITDECNHLPVPDHRLASGHNGSKAAPVPKASSLHTALDQDAVADQAARSPNRNSRRIAAGLVLALAGVGGIIGLFKYRPGKVMGEPEIRGAVSMKLRPESQVAESGRVIAPDVPAAEWVLSLGGGVQIQDFGKSEIRDVARSADLPRSGFRLIGINLNSNLRLSDADLEHLDGLNYLTHLDLHRTKVTNVGMRHLRGLTSLRVLSLHHTKISDAALEYVDDLRQLSVLVLTETDITDVGLENIARLVKLETLDLGGSRVTDAGLRHLKGLSQLAQLGLQFTRISSAGLATLRELPQLRLLDLSGLAIDDAAIKALARLKLLKLLVLIAARMSPADEAKLRAALPNCELRCHEAKTPGKVPGAGG